MRKWIPDHYTAEQAADAAIVGLVIAAWVAILVMAATGAL